MQDLQNRGVDERQIVTAVRQLIQGRNNAIGTVTLGSGNTTTVTNEVINANGSIWLTPRTPQAAIEMASGRLFISDVSAGSFEITHSSAEDDTTTILVVENDGDEVIDSSGNNVILGDAKSGRTFDYICLGG